MAVVSSDFLEALLTNYQAMFRDGLANEAPRQRWRDLVIETMSNSEMESYNWFGAPPQMQNTTHDQVTYTDLSRYNLTIRNDDWSGGFKIKFHAIRRDKLGLLRNKPTELARKAARHPGKLIWELFQTPGNAYDGLPFFGTTREIGKSGVINNTMTGNGRSVNNIRNDLATARAQMRRFRDDAGEPMDLLGNIIVCPAELEANMYIALSQVILGTNQSVPPAATDGLIQASGYTILVNPYLTDVNNWFLCSAQGGEQMPVIFQVEVAPRLLSDTNPQSRLAIETKEAVYVADGSYGVGLTDPRFIISVTNSG